MKHHSLLFLFIFFILGLVGYSQVNPIDVPKTTPLPPDLATLFKVLERPVGASTGTVPVEFPLCGITSGLLSTNLSLSYVSTGGIKARERAGSMGLGFTLNGAGGSITQFINDRSDDLQNGMLNPNNVRPSTFNTSDLQGDPFGYYHRSPGGGGMDLEPDLFMYNINGQSGRFFFKENGEVVMMEKTDIKIEYTSYPGILNFGIRQWIVTDGAGNKYYFGKNKAGTVNYYLTNSWQYQDSQSATSSSGPSSNSWYLTEVYDINEENKITYTYVESSNQNTTQLYPFIPFSITGGDCQGLNLHPNFSTSVTSAHEYIVSRIDSDKGYIKVNSTNDRLDLISHKINSIQLFKTDNTLVKEFVFDYSYFGTSTNANRLLKLNKFTEKSSNGLEVHNYSFEYDQTYKIPSDPSYNVDYWGFFNGKNNSSVFPNVVRPGYSRFDLADRSSNYNYAKTNILKKINYPTGGSREFVYEGNTALTQFSQDSYHPDSSNSTMNQIISTNFPLSSDPNVPSLKQYFTFNNAAGNTVLNYNALASGNCSGFHIRLYKIQQSNQANGGELWGDRTERNYNFTVPNGMYRVEVFNSPQGCTINNVIWKWTILNRSLGTIQTPYGKFNENNIKVGGVRIKEIKDYDPVSNKTFKTEYKYNLYSTDSTKTSGLLISPISLVATGSRGNVRCGFYKLLESPINPYSADGGSYVSYTEVRTIEQGNGWTDRVYNFEIDGSDPMMLPPVKPSDDNRARRGKLLEEKIYNNSGNLLKKTTNRYGTGPWDSQKGLKVKVYFGPNISLNENYWSDSPHPSIPNQVPGSVFTNEYTLYGQDSFLTSTTEINYASTGNVSTQTDYEYVTNARANPAVKKVKQILTNGDIKSQVFNYAITPDNEFVFGTNALKSVLLSKNYLKPLETISYILPSAGTNTILGGNKYTFFNINNKVRLGQISNYVQSTLSSNLNFSNYSSYGFIQEQYKDNDVKEVYLWGYNGQYPVAKIVGSDYNTVEAMINNSILLNPASDQQLRNEINIIRTNLLGTAMVTTYTHSPLIGVTSITDPKGDIITYTYDSFGRLETVKDAQGNLLSENQYHYKN
ncbi:RHS repeat domain-containing protein [Flavobacterium sp. FlaQc-47]|uniref:RHS repeat protein n=1 Tax=Flavobacterium sp. FlaQc-47 TaxID=3374180 RepID=UPI0037577F00